jgi:hypothetical protein
MQKDIESTEKICTMNNNIKKKLKEYDSFKELIIECLGGIYKQLSKKIRKAYDSELMNKNRTSKCEVYFKSINEYLKTIIENNNVVQTFIQR